LESGAAILYDALSLNVGSEVPVDLIPGAAGHGIAVKPVRNFLDLQQALKGWEPGRGPLHVLVVGAGPAGCEAAANALRLLAHRKGAHHLCVVTSDTDVLGEHPRSARRFMGRWFEERGVEVLTDTRVERIEDRRAVFRDGGTKPCDILVLATGVRPPSLMRDSGLATANDGALRVNAYLQSVQWPKIFGGGDCVALEPAGLPRVGVYAVRQGPVLFHNLAAVLSGRTMRTFRPQAHFLLILNLGDGTGLLMWRGLALHARWAFQFKDWLDRRFMKEYKA
jgi:NADH dehydrogenase FAD-containing subunit